jgi:hypothetical protein
MNHNTSRLLACLRVPLLATLLGTFAPTADAQTGCAMVQIQNLSTSTNLCKCGFGECLVSTPPKYFLVQTTVSSYAATQYTNSTSSSVTEIETCSPPSCNQSTSYSGSCSYSGEGYLPSVNDVYVGNFSATMDTNGDWSDGGFCYLLQLPFGNPIPINCTNQCTSTVTSQNCYTNGGANSTFTQTLSSEFTDNMLQGYIISDMPTYPTNWSPGSGMAFWQWGDSNHICASGGKMKYRFYVTNTQLHTTYEIKWLEITTYPNGTATTQTKSEEVPGNGNPFNGVYSSTREVPVPATPCSIWEAGVTITVVPQGQAGS